MSTLAPAQVFTVANTSVLPCWLLLILAPRWRWTMRLVTFAAPVLLALVYAWMLATAPASPGASFNTLAGVRTLFTTDQALTAGWIHYLAFDLFTGAWESRDAHRLGIARWIVIPCMLMTFLFGPIGLAAYLVLRALLRREVGVFEPQVRTRAEVTQ